MKINLFEPYIDKSEERSTLRTLRSKFWASGLGTGNVKNLKTNLKNL